jgi:methylmalonyl-CoA mutase, N-terminal domain
VFLKDAARSSDNLMPAILEASRAYATVGEMCDALREVFGEYEEAPVF